MKGENLKILGWTLSIIGLIMLIIGAISYLGGFNWVSNNVSFLGLIIAVIGMYINNKTLFGKKK